jgi:glycosyltransferase involved in cell wall biosynthesis
MRVLTVANHLGSRGGLERTQMTTGQALARRGHEVDLLYVSAGDFADTWRGFAAHMVSTSGTLPRRRRPVSSTAGLLRAVAAGLRLGPEVLYVFRYWDLPYAAAVGSISGAPVVFHLCLPPPRTVPRWLRVALRRVDRTLSVSRDTADRWAGSGLDPRRVEVTLTGVDLERFAPGSETARLEARRELGLGADDFLVLYAGRLGREKGVHVLVAAFAEVARRCPDARLVIVGAASLGADPADSARYEEELRTAASGLPVTILPGRPDVVPLVQAADVAVVPSLWPEPLPRAVLEPLACGTPVVATAVGGNPEVLTGPLADLLVTADDPSALSERLASLRDWRHTDPELGLRCRRYAEEHLDVRRETDQVERALLDVVAARSRRARRWRSASANEPKS